MGKKKGGKGADGTKGEDNGVWQTSPDVRENAEWEAYYLQQNIVPDEEWPRFLECLRTDLPTAFRVVTCTPHQHYIRQYIHRTMEHAFHRFLVAQSEAATIMRQEVVSMIPALFFDIKADSCVLDLCAAPGSKTSQLLERMHVVHEKERAHARRKRLDQETGPSAPPHEASLHAEITALVPPGLVVANDADSGRAHMLIHHLRHIHSPCLLVTSHSAQFFPAILVPSAPSEAAATPGASTPTDRAAAPSPPCLEDRQGTVCPSAFPSSHLRPLLFDCVLCDVPCSADGTLRKARSLWTRWHSNQGLGCHRLQLQILLRGIKLCKVNGRIVYSTCSFNPVENEAVVAAALEKTKGAVELVDCSGVFPALERRPGLHTWRVYWQKEFYDRYEDVPDTSASRQKIRPTMFPQYAASKAAGDGDGKRQEGPPLHRCMRFLPHLNNTGGFFVAVLEKKKHVPFHVQSASENAQTRPPQGTHGDGNMHDDDEEEEEERENEDQETEVKPAPSCADPQEESLGVCIESSRKAVGNVASEGGQGLRTLDQLQLDFVSLGWPQSFVEKQQKQYIRKVQQTLAAEAAREESAQSELSEEKEKRAVPVSEFVGQDGENEGACIHEEKLRAAWRAACASLGVTKDFAVGAEERMPAAEVSEDEEGVGGERRRLRLLQELRACLFVRRRGEGENISMARKKPKRENAESSRENPTAAETVLESSGEEKAKSRGSVSPNAASSTAQQAAVTGISAEQSADVGSSGKDEKLLRTVWLTSHGVERALSGVGRSRYKVVSAGCVAFQCRNSSKYRLSYGGAQWLVPLVDAVDCREAATEPSCGTTGPDDSRGAVLLPGGDSENVKPDRRGNGEQPPGTQCQEKAKEARVILRISNELMMALLGDEGAPPRVDMSTLKHVEGGAELRQMTEEGPLVLVTTVLPERETEAGMTPCAQQTGDASEKAGDTDMSGGGKQAGERMTPTTLILDVVSEQAPAWRGRSNIELMVDAYTCHALRCLLIHRRSPVSSSAPPGGSAQENEISGICK
ncbi:Multisite-specific tRNA m(5)C methyltransferase, related [Neospora caninum Liverpool]|uniref:Multisite-specific tRNA m(5)C methyltransferase, related n=1 Tax=Neospora caninum (strain Liverpool) TaxID=572307 RepID=F0VH86_NEOCL|nr:Multisite-specific tRNA m(5)C methyltransferase, related [Neospora caninum Liverpool]CBZ53080.1 Multisite-specific tRNA m(5)C methyltransferase, related [Neospora caninum Liverpool]CEL67064.1 TPA: Multisite-specific tRNA m(5)C methyltransferase, related [Neospora caninum Liverpool]|eukprot:XP_003883112.1 Multisite-specific tRNA m(5)C methyltransferase, related [Neospora caninum Liverpool]